jgi:hypothetical protein
MSGSATACANCGAALSGAYCSACGQRADHHVLSIGEFLAEALEVFTHADSRFWRTFVPLLVRPGYLTQQFIGGRRMRYLPPFRLYIVISVLFFLVVPLTARFEAPQVMTPELRAKAAAEVRADLQREIDAATDPAEKALLQAQLQKIVALGNTFDPALGKGWDAMSCQVSVADVELPAWLGPRVTQACERIREDHGRELGHSLLHNLGRAMLVLLPLLALLMKLLYWRPPHRYVEHLLLLLHNHAFGFFGMTVLLVATRLVPSESFGGMLSGLFTLYGAWYLFESMRRVYGQGWLRTAVKFSVLTVAYFSCALLMFVLTTIYSAATL